MPGIRKVSLFSSFKKDPNYDDNDHIQYCQSCFKIGIKSELKRRVYRVENSMLIREEPPAPDADKWRQCYRCGDIVAVYNVKQESSLVDFTQTITNPFDENKDNMNSLKRSNRLKKTKNKYTRKRAQLSKIKDEDLKNELSKGAELVHYMER